MTKDGWRRGTASEIRWVAALRMATVVAFCVAFAVYMFSSRHWPLIHDSQVIHYVTFLIDRGWAPYRQIGDMNMPGSYLIEDWALHLFGSSDLGWRFFDFSVCGAGIAAMCCIARRYDWLAGFVGGGTFVLIHASRGPVDAGQRDMTMAVLLLAGYAFCFESVRQTKPWLMAPFAICAGMAASIKPTLALTGPLVLTLAVFALRREKVRTGRFVLWGLAGAIVPTVIVFAFLLSHKALQAFVTNLTQVLPHYAGVSPMPWGTLILSTLSVATFVYVGLAVAAACIDRNWRNWESGALLCGVVFGALSFYSQRKGFPYHRYTTLAFVLVWATIQMFLSLRSRGLGRGFAWAGLAFAMLFLLPHNLKVMRLFTSEDNFTRYLEHDLDQIGTDRLQGKVVCLDIIEGCLKALYQLKIVQSTGSTGDLLLFLPQHAPVVESARAGFLAAVESAPPDYFVLTNQPFLGVPTFHKIDTWPAFASLLQEHYEMVVQREFLQGVPTSRPGTDPAYPAYRIFKRLSGGAGS